MTRLSVVGLGKVGACIAAALAHRGFDVCGVDVNQHTVSLINAGEPPVFEPGLKEMMAGTRERLRATADCYQAVRDSAVTFIVVSTPSEDHGRLSLKYVRAAAVEIGRALRDKHERHTVVLTSTVLPGSSEYSVIPVLEHESGKRCGKDFGFCYFPEFLAFLNPDFLLVGESDSETGKHFAEIAQQSCENGALISRMSIINAELAKIAVNTYVTMKIIFANMLAALCEELPGGDVDAVTSALGRDSRIGPRYLKGALGYGGPCFPRDSRALAFLARQLGHPAVLVEAVDDYNGSVSDRVIKKICSCLPAQALVGVLGLAYKPGTAVVEGSQALRIADALATKGAQGHGL